MEDHLVSEPAKKTQHVNETSLELPGGTPPLLVEAKRH